MGIDKYSTNHGKPLPFGATPTAHGYNFSIYSKNATGCTLVLFEPSVTDAVQEIELTESWNKTGNVWHVEVLGAGDDIRYGWRMDGDNSARIGNMFNKDIILIDPYAKALTGGAKWGEPQIRREIKPQKDYSEFVRRCAVGTAEFDWQGSRPVSRSLEDTIIYELHVRGYTIMDNSGVEHKGTYKGLIEKIPYIKGLGVTAVELMPIFEFDENEHMRHNESGDILRNYWGYSPVCFFAPKASYAANGSDYNQINEFKEMIREFHNAGIEVYLDVVFNHTAEGDERGPVISFRGIDNSSYYILDEDGKYKNYSGCGNTFNCNDPTNQSLIIDCLRYWVSEMHVDGFRFDLASILGRGEDGEVLQNPPLLERIAKDPVLAATKVIAEAWDAAGLNQVGHFPHFDRWSEWNGYYRDNVRMFWRGQEGMVSPVASRICGSDDLYHKAPKQGINFITAHDGFTLYDLISYKEKHNLANGENNMDGENNNHSMNFGVEGDTDNEEVRSIRYQMLKNFILTLFISQGVPMLLAGDEFGRTQQGNNNAYCQDNEISWVDWDLLQENKDIYDFTRKMILFRKRHPVLTRSTFFRNGKGITWYGAHGKGADWSASSKLLTFMLDGECINQCTKNCNCSKSLFVMLNAAESRAYIDIPDIGRDWVRMVDTSLASPNDIFESPDQGVFVGRSCIKYRVRPRSAVILEC